MKHLTVLLSSLFSNTDASTQVNDGVSSPIPPNYDLDLVAYVTVGILGVCSPFKFDIFYVRHF
jgi:hypothetical protein